MSSFRNDAINYVKKIPRGRVVSYGQAALACGNPRAARQVGGILKSIGTSEAVPWWRVLNNKGIISIKGNWEATKQLQRELLLKEGVAVGEDFSLDMQEYRWVEK
jgi:methylated-DNA-protein-cysteine methyltransferase-like protein